MHTKTITELAKSLRAKEFSSVELTHAYLDRIKQYSELNSFITVTEEQALTAANAADKALSLGNAPLLTGIPIAQTRHWGR